MEIVNNKMTRPFDFVMILFTSAIITGLKESNDFFQNYTKVRYASRKFDDADRLAIQNIHVLILSIYILLFIWFPLSIYVETVNQYKQNYIYLTIYTSFSILIILYIIAITIYIRFEWVNKYIKPIITEKSSLTPELQKNIIDINSFMTVNSVFYIAIVIFMSYTILQLWKDKINYF